MNRRPRIVLYQSQQVNQRIGHQASFDMLPLEMLHIAAIPVSRGYDVQIIDAAPHWLRGDVVRVVEPARRARTRIPVAAV